MTTQAYHWTNASQVAFNTRGGKRFFLLTSLIFIDLMMTLLGFWLAYILRFEASFSWFYQHEGSQLGHYQWLVFLLALIWIGIFAIFGLYNFKNLFSGMHEYAWTFNACTLSTMLIIFMTFFDPNFTVARGWVVLSWLLVSFFVGAGRFGVRRAVQRFRERGYFLTPIVIVGANEEARAIAHQLQSNEKAGIKVIGFVDDTLAKDELLEGVPVLGSVDSLPALVQKIDIQEVFVASTALRREKLLNLFQMFDTTDIPLRLSSGLYEMLTTGVEVHEVANVPLVSVNKVRLSGADVIMKRVLDLVLSAIAILVFLPVMAALALIVKFNSPGPIIYLRRVVGVGGKTFNAFKFRTMYVDADERLHQDPDLRRQFEQNFKLKDDPRVTRVGEFLRKYSLDELPQFFNVLLGQMSLVGPRMITEPERARYGKWSMNLATVKPGITGLWQVSGRSDVGYDERVKLDMHYIRNHSIWFDLHLLWQTIPAVLRKRGAY